MVSIYLSLSLFLFFFVDVPSLSRNELFIKKLRQCCVLLDFAQPQKDLTGKEIKREALVQCVEYLASNREPLNDPAYAACFEMVLPIAFTTQPNKHATNT